MRMEINEDLIRHVAEVARLELTEGEVKEFLPQLKEVIEAFGELSGVDTKDVKPSFQSVMLKNCLREDKVTPSLSQQDALKNARNKKDGYFLGPKAV